MCETLNIPESTILSYIKRMKKFSETDVVRPLDAYYVERLHEDFSKIILQTKKILEVATAGVKVDKSTQVDSYRIGCGFDTREFVQARNPFFFDPSYKTPHSRGLCGSLDNSVQLESRYDTIREYYYNNYFEQGKMKTHPICPTVLLNPTQAAWDNVSDKVIIPTPKEKLQNDGCVSPMHVIF